MLDLLGGKCVRCGAIKKLQFDIITRALAPDYERHHRDMCWGRRMSFYKRALRLNNLQLLCQKCNNNKKHHQDQEYYEPF